MKTTTIIRLFAYKEISSTTSIRGKYFRTYWKTNDHVFTQYLTTCLYFNKGLKKYIVEFENSVECLIKCAYPSYM